MSPGPLPLWLQRLLGADGADAGEGTVWSLQHGWNWAPWFTLLFALCVAGYLGWVYARDGAGTARFYRASLWLLRCAAIGLVLLMIAELALARQRTGLPHAVVLVDDSASMGIVDRYADAGVAAELEPLARAGAGSAAGAELTRWNLARGLLLSEQQKFLRELSSRYRLRVYLMSSTARAQAGEIDEVTKSLLKALPLGESSRLGACLQTALDDLRGSPPAAVIVITDGVTTDGESLSRVAEGAAERHVPLYMVGTGTREPKRNVRVHDMLVDDHVFLGDVLSVEAQVTSTGLEGRSLSVTLRDADAPDAAPLATLDVKAGPDGEPVRVTIPYRPQRVGSYRFIVESLPLSEEETVDDNREERSVEVHEGKIKVLMVQSSPSFEFRRLKDMLERDTTIELRTVLQEADLEFAAADRTALRVFPVRRDKLSDEDDQALFYYDVVLFGDVNPALLSVSALKNLADFVSEQGRGMIFVAGPRYTPQAFRGTPLSALIPVEMSQLTSAAAGSAQGEPFHVRPTALGIASGPFQLGDSRAETERIWRELPPLYWQFDSLKLKPAARVLAEHPTRLGEDGKNLPLFVSQYVNRGRVLFHATDETWRWRYRVGDAFFARYWVQTIRHMSRSKLQQDAAAELTTDRQEYRRGESVRLRLQFFDERAAPQADDGVTVVVERSGQANQTLTLRRGAQARGIFDGVLPNPGDGKHHVRVVAPTFAGGPPDANFSVVAPPGELRQLQLDVAELKSAAKKTGGAYYPLHEARKILSDLPAGREVPIESLEPLVLWNRWPILLVFTLVLALEWILRKWKGLL